MKKEIVGEFFKFLRRKESRDIPFFLYGNIVQMPERMVIEGDLSIFDTDLEWYSLEKFYFPETLEVRGDLRLFGSRYDILPETLTIQGNVGFSGLEPHHIFPKQVLAKSVLFGETTIKDISFNIRTKNYLSIEESKIEKISGKLEVGTTFFCGDAPLSEKYTEEEIKKMIEDRGGSFHKIDTSVEEY